MVWNRLSISLRSTSSWLLQWKIDVFMVSRFLCQLSRTRHPQMFCVNPSEGVNFWLCFIIIITVMKVSPVSSSSLLWWRSRAVCMTRQYWHTSSSVHPFVQAWNIRVLTRTLLSACACSRRRQTSCVWLWKGCWTPCWPWPCPPRPSPSPHTPFTWPYPHPPRRACFETSVCWAHVAFRSVHASVSLWWDGRPRRSTMRCVVIVGRFYIALFSNFKQTRSTYVACDSEWVTNFL